MMTIASDRILKEHMIIQARTYENCNLQLPNEVAIYF